MKRIKKKTSASEAGGGKGEETVLVRPLTVGDWDRVRKIFEEGIATGTATFESAAPSWEDWDASHERPCRLVAETAEEVVGWTALSRVSSRCVYAGVAEVSIYMAADFRGRGIGTHLLRALIRASEENGFWTLQSGIFPENEASIRLHEKCGFRLVGRRERLGRKEERWQDVLLYERRSPIVG